MQNAIRWAALVLALASTPAAAGAAGTSSRGDRGDGARASAMVSDDDGVGAGPASPADPDSMRYERGAREDPSGDPVRARDAGDTRSTADALQQWRHEKFLEEIWAPNP